MEEIETILKLNNKLLTKKEKNLLERAYAFAQKAHEGQKRDSGEARFNHVFEAAKNLAKMDVSVTMVAAGLLHDSIENTGVTKKQLLKEFGEEIVLMVDGVTKLSKIKYKGPEHSVENLRKFFLASAKDIRVVIIRLADRLNNLQTLRYKTPEKQKNLALETIEIHARLADRLGIGKLKGELEDAAFPFAYPKEYKLVNKIIKRKQSIYEGYLLRISRKLKNELKKRGVKVFEMSNRLKHKYSLYQKLVKYDMDIEKVYDIVSLRIVVNTIEECYAALGVIHSIYNPLPGRIKDYISLPKLNGYRSLHTTIFTGWGGIVEIQIRTKEMNAEAYYGIATRFAYKENAKGKIINNKKFKWIEELKKLKYHPEDQDSLSENLKMDFFNSCIYVFTPRGDVLDLPEDSTPLDFAYSIHSDLGDHTYGARINGKIIQLFTKLKNGDIVEIVKKKETHPSSKWLEHVKTSVAKKHIKSYLEKGVLPIK